MVRLTPCTHGACIPLHEDPLWCKPLYEILSVTREGAALWIFYTPRKTLRFTLVCFTVVFKLSRDFKWNHSAWDSDMTLSPGNTLGHVHSYLGMRTACGLQTEHIWSWIYYFSCMLTFKAQCCCAAFGDSTYTHLQCLVSISVYEFSERAESCS